MTWLAADTAGQFIPSDHYRDFLRTPRQLSDFTPFLQDLCDWAEWENRADETRRHRKWVKSHMFYEGRQLGRIGKDGNWRDITPLPSDPYFVDNRFRFFAKSVRKEWVRSSAELVAHGKTGTPEADGAARAAKAIIQSEFARIWTPPMRQREAIFAIITGNYFRYTYFDPNKGQVLNIPVFQEQPATVGQEGLACYDCGAMSPAMPDPMALEEVACPNCGSPNVEPINGEMVNIPAQVGTQAQMAGQVVTEVVDPMEIKLHLHSRSMLDSPYLRRKRFVLRDVIEATYPWVQFHEGDNSTLTGLWYQHELERSPGNASGTGRAVYGEGTADRYGRMVELDQLWLEPILYATYTLEKPLELATGEAIPAGVRLAEIFPDGMYVARVGRAFVDIRNERRSEHWVHGQYDVVPTRVWGDGNEDAIEQQRQHNEISSLVFTNIMNCDAPATIYNPLKISRSQYSGKPQEMVPLKNATLADEPAKYIWTPDPRPVGGEPINYRQMLEQSMQSSFNAFNAINGLPDADNKTATGISIVRDAAMSLLGVPLELKAYCDLEHGKQILKLIQANWTPDLYAPMLGDHGEAPAQWFAQCDIENDIEITLRPNSHVPRDEAQRRQDFVDSTTVGGVPLGMHSPMFPPDLRPQAAEVFNQPFDEDKQRIHMHNQYMEILAILGSVEQSMMQNQMMGLPPEGMQLPVGPPPQESPQMQPGAPQGDPNQMAMQQPMLQLGIDPMMAAMTVAPVQPDIDEHIFHIEEIKRYLNTDKGKQSFPFGSPQYNALLMHLQLHKQGMMMQMAEQMMMQGGPMGGEGGEGGGENGPPAKGKGKEKNGSASNKDGGNIPIGKDGRPHPKPPKSGEQGK